MLRVALYACCLTLLLLMAVWSTPAAGQVADSVRLRASVDTLKIEGCRGGTITASGTCLNRRYSARSATVHRLAMRLDSLVRRVSPPTPPGQAPVASAAVGFGTTWHTRYNAEWPGTANPGTDTATVCAVVYPTLGDTVKVNARVGWPAIRVRLMGDSATFFARGGNALADMCNPAVKRWGETVTTDSVTAPRVSWRLVQVQVRVADGSLRMQWRPVAGPP